MAFPVPNWVHSLGLPSLASAMSELEAAHLYDTDDLDAREGGWGAVYSDESKTAPPPL